MPINWGSLQALRNRQAILKALKKIITPDNYGTGENQWSLTELINTRTNASEDSFRLIQGVDELGQSVGTGPMMGQGGLPLTIKLKVLSRQACFETADGKGINDWDSTDLVGENDNNELCPAFDEPPKPGDVVWVKQNPLTHDPETGKRIWKKTGLVVIARTEAEMGREIKPDKALYHHLKYSVDDDGCITVPFLIALQLLKTKGHKIALARFKGGSKRGDPKKTRQITNWLFKEVCGDEDKPTSEAKTKKKPSGTRPGGLAN